ncbi:MAG TPA: OmpA family protein [Novosphingobium sp.]
MRGILAAAAAASLLLAGCQTLPRQPADFTAAQVGVLRQHGFRSVDGNWELGIEEQLLFDTGTSTLAPGQQVVVERLARSLLAAGIKGGLLEGHTDSVGSALFNQELARARAEAVKAAMVAAGMKADQIRLVSLGEGYPAQSNRTPRGRRENRRVILIVTPSDAG